MIGRPSWRGPTAALATAVLLAPALPRPQVPANECDTAAQGWIWCDDFETDRAGSYFEYDRARGQFVRTAGAGRGGSFGMEARWTAGQVAVGALHLAFGRTPDPSIRPVDGGTRHYREIYWRIYVRYEPGWTGGGGNKLTRAQILASGSWAQAMVAPVWSGSKGPDRERLMIDPVSGTDPAGTLRTTGYGDEPHLRYLGAGPGRTRLFSPGALGRWYCIEAHVRLNDPARSNGVFELWVDGRPEVRRARLNWVGSYSEFGVNTVFVENYWNAGAPKAQSRFFDHFVVSTERIGCLPA